MSLEVKTSQDSRRSKVLLDSELHEFLNIQENLLFDVIDYVEMCYGSHRN